MSWEIAAQPDEVLSPPYRAMRNTIRASLHAIQVSEAYQDPSLDPAEAGFSDIDAAWLDGAIAPLQVSSILGTLHKILPQESRQICAEFFERSAAIPDEDKDSSDTEKTAIAVAGLELIEDLKGTTELAKSLPGLMVSLNIHAPQRAVVDAVKSLHADLRARLDIEEHRRRWNKLGEYLNVWDRREGWEAGTYDARRETPLRDISQELGLPVSSVLNHYKKAFEYVFGHSYTPELWSRYMFVPKYGGFLGSAPSIQRTRRDRQSRTRRDVPSSSVGEQGAGDFVSSAAETTDSISESNWLMDLQSLIGLGRTDAQIAQELECKESEAAHARSVFEARQAEGL
jgi:hypothetical protein